MSKCILYGGPYAGKVYKSSSGKEFHIAFIQDGKYGNAIYKLDDYNKEQNVFFFMFDRLNYIGECVEGSEDYKGEYDV
jgi:hypothetical protein